MILDIGTAMTDLSSFRNMNDFYAIYLFSLKNAFKSKNSNYFYIYWCTFLPWIYLGIHAFISKLTNNFVI